MFDFNKPVPLQSQESMFLIFHCLTFVKSKRWQKFSHPKVIRLCCTKIHSILMWKSNLSKVFFKYFNGSQHQGSSVSKDLIVYMFIVTIPFSKKTNEFFIAHIKVRSQRSRIWRTRSNQIQLRTKSDSSKPALVISLATPGWLIIHRQNFRTSFAGANFGQREFSYAWIKSTQAYS